MTKKRPKPVGKGSGRKIGSRHLTAAPPRAPVRAVPGMTKVRNVGTPDDQGTSTKILEGVRTLGTTSPGRGTKRIGVPKQGLSLGGKFALITSMVTASLVFFTGIFIFLLIQSTFTAEIDRKGAALVKSLTYIAKEYYEAYQQASQESDEEGLDAVREKFKAYLRSLVFYHRPNSTELRSDEILNLTIRNTQGNYPPTIFTGDSVKVRGERACYLEVIDNISYPTDIYIIQGQASYRQSEVAIRAYSMPLTNIGLEVMVVLSKKAIDRTKSHLLLIIGASTVMAVIIGVVVSFFLANHVTNPIRRLMRDIEIVARGELDHQTVPTSNDEIGILAHTFNTLTRNLKAAHENELEHKAIELEEKARKSELDIATEIQANLLPKKIPRIKGYDIDAFYSPSKEVGGDYYDFIEIDEDHLGLIVADVSGKGIPGSMVMTMARALIRMEAYRNLSPADTFKKVNRIIAQDIRRGMFVTAFYIIVTIKTGEMLIASAGHNPAVFKRPKSPKYRLLNPSGIALGFDQGPLFDRSIKEEKIQLQVGDRVVLYTDGVPEAMNPQNEEFGDNRFYHIIGREGDQNSNQFVNILVTALDEWRADGPQSDDITIVTLRRVS